MRSVGTEEGVFDHLLGDELRRVVRAQRGPRPRAFQAYYHKRGGGVVWSVRLAAVGFTAVTLTAGAAAYAAAAGARKADPLNLVEGVRRTVGTLGQQRSWGLGPLPSRRSGSQGNDRPAPAPQLGKPAPAGSQPVSQGGAQGRDPGTSSRPSASPGSRSRPGSYPSSNPSPSGGSGGRGGHRKQPGG